MPSIFGRPSVEDDDIVGLGLAEEVALLAIEGGVDGVAGVGEGRDQLAIEIAIVLDNQNPHGSPPRLARPRGQAPACVGAGPQG